MTPLLECNHLVKRFGGAGADPVLDDLSLVLEAGQCLVLLGPSGCGKSTLLHSIAGITPPDAGSIRFDGKALDDPAHGIHVPLHERGFSLVFQDFSLFPHLDVRENVAFGPREHGRSRATIDEAVHSALRLVHMEAFASRRVAELSGGQQQRIAIARAIAVKPRLLLLDEPLSALDARLRDELREQIAEVLEILELACVFVTHDQGEAFALADKVALMAAGKIVQLGTPQDIYSAPSSRTAAEFVGAANLHGYHAERGITVLDSGDELLVEPHANRGHLMVRREAISVEPTNVRARQADASIQRDNSGEIVFDAVCERVRFLGDRHEVTVSTTRGARFRAFMASPPVAGVPVTLTIPTAAVRFLPE